MVRVIEDSPEEKATEKKNLEIIVEVVRKMFGEENILELDVLENVLVKDSITSDPLIQVCSKIFNIIYVYDQKYFNSAIELGEAIEKRIPGLEFDLERMY